ncbi:MAG: 6-carboxytetrahydropterin synthase [Clostridiales bacterium]|nr:6-carboxytetrahydropterin synthase [Clostridiales bacterium]
MYYLKTESCFDSAHFLSGYEGKCSNIHGHRWRVVVEIGGDNLNQDRQTRGMLCDFSALKEALRDETESLDHRLIIEKGSMKEALLNMLRENGFNVTEVLFRPTAESFAKYFFDRMKMRGYSVKSTEVYETPVNYARYEEGL